MEKGVIHQQRAVVAYDQPAEISQPGKGTFDFPALAVASQRPAILRWRLHSVAAVRTDQFDASGLQLFSQRIAVVASVGDEAFQFALGPATTTAGHSDLRQGLFDQLYFRGRRAVQVVSQRNTLAVDHHHALRTLSALRVSDVSAPFFAAVNEPSMNAFSQRSRPRASSSPRKARHRASHVPSSSHSRIRRQQVAPLGYPSGRSRHRAPVFSTQRIPSMTSRWPMRGRPPVRARRGRGRCRSIWAHCASVTRTLRLATSTSDQGRTAARRQVQVLFTSSPGF